MIAIGQYLGPAVISYSQGYPESLTRVYRKHKIAVYLKSHQTLPHQTLRNMLVHPKDKRDMLDSCNMVYHIPVKNCDSSYIGETGRKC